MVLGRLAHYTFDALLISALLAGVRRSTGITPSLNTNKITDSETVKTFVEGYLSIGEWAMDQSVGYLKSSKYFEKKR